MIMSPSICLAALLLAGDSPRGGVPVSYVPLPALPPQSSKKPKAEEDPMQSMKRARQALTEFAKATTVEEMAKHVRHPETALPRMKAFYGDTKLKPIEMEFSSDWREVERGKQTLITTTVRIDFKDIYMVVEVPGKDGPALVDWESFIGWCEMPWTDFVKKGSKTAREFRLAVTASDYFNFNYADSKKYAAFRLVDKDDTETIYAYCDLTSETCKKLLASLRQARQQSGRKDEEPVETFTLKLSMNEEDTARRQALIEGIVFQGWVAP